MDAVGREVEEQEQINKVKGRSYTPVVNRMFVPCDITQSLHHHPLPVVEK